MMTTTIPLFKSLSFRLAAWGTLIALSLGVAFSFLQIYVDYFSVQKESDNTTQQVLKTLRKPAAQAVYQLDPVLGYEVVEGLMQYEPIWKVELLDDTGILLAEGENKRAATSWGWLLGLLFEENRYYHLPLYIDTENGETRYGTLNVVVDTRMISASFVSRSALVLLSGIARNLLLAAIMFLAFQYMVNRPLKKMVQRLSTINPDKPGQVQIAYPHRHEQDEFGLLVASTNDLLHSIDIKAQEREHLLSDMEVAKQAAESANVAKSQFIAKMSHELRTPLNAIIGYSEILQEELEEMETHEAINDLVRIHGAGTHLLNMVNDILDLAKIETGRMELQITPCDVEAIGKELEETIRPRAEKNHNQLFCHCSAELGVIYADATKLRQCLLNLLDNACKYTTNGDVHLIVKHQQKENQDWFHFIIRDSGLGMTAEQLGRIFTAFSQADDSCTRQYDGSGLGLTITKNLAQMLGGDVTVSSTLGKGSEFILSLPSQTPSV